MNNSVLIQYFDLIGSNVGTTFDTYDLCITPTWIDLFRGPNPFTLQELIDLQTQFQHETFPGARYCAFINIQKNSKFSNTIIHELKIPRSVFISFENYIESFSLHGLSFWTYLK